jgi:NAD(P)-dependent dehydrogenase (short-subunit alcohol dehydrogenase family)
MPGRLEGKVAVVTGGTSGIGEATVRLFIEEGARVVFCGRSAEAGERIAAEVGAPARFIRADVRREEDIKATIDLALGEFGRLDCLFNNAGGPTGGTLETVTTGEFRDAMDLLVGSVVFGIKHAAPVMKGQGSGRIINNSSVAALRTAMGQYLYSAAKAAVTQLTRVAGMELARYGITVNSISPGGIATPIFYGGSEAARQLDPAHEGAKMRKLTANLGAFTPLGRAGTPRDVAYAALYLASDEGAFVNCHDLVVDAGMTAGQRPEYG